MRISLSSVLLGLPLWALAFCFLPFAIHPSDKLASWSAALCSNINADGRRSAACTPQLPPPSVLGSGHENQRLQLLRTNATIFRLPVTAQTPNTPPVARGRVLRIIYQGHWARERERERGRRASTRPALKPSPCAKDHEAKRCASWLSPVYVCMM